MTFDPTAPLTRANFAQLPVLCLDGAWGTEMAKQGVPPGELGESWNLTHPDRVRAVARAYVDAGAQIVLTNTFSANAFVLEKHGAADRLAEINRAGAALSKEGAAGRAYVFGSLGPSGRMVMMGEATPEAIEEAYAVQAAALVAGGADALVLETQTDAVEAEAALRGCLRAVEVPVGVSFTFDAGPEGAHTIMGLSVEQAWELAARLELSFVGANCGAGIDTFAKLAARMAACGELPVWVKGNAGRPVMENGCVVYRMDPATFGREAAALIGAGARFIGGCCGSTPEHVRAMRRAVDAHQG